MTRDENLPDALVIDKVNGNLVEPLRVTMGDVSTVDGTASAICDTKIKPLAKHFKKGINTFELAYTENAERVATEVILDIQM